QVLFGRPQILRGVDRPQHRVRCYLLVEPVHQPGECLLAADCLVEGTRRLCCFFAHDSCQGSKHVTGGWAGQRARPVSRATKARQSPASSADNDTAPCPRPTRPSARSSTGRSEPVACCSAAHILYACTGSTRVSLVNTVNSTAG